MSTSQPEGSPTTWVAGADLSEFPLAGLPYGVFVAGPGRVHVGVAIGDRILDLDAVAEAGLFEVGLLPPGVFRTGTLNGFLALGGETWGRTRGCITDLLSEGNDDLTPILTEALLPRASAQMVLPVSVGDYVDFYSSEHHAVNLGSMFRPDGEPLLPNWRYLPVGYHGRASTIVVDGTRIVRPAGQCRGPDGAPPEFGPSTRLDFELEVGFITGAATDRSGPLPIDAAEETIFGMCLVNDWSARDIQAWEYQPLGPFLGKSFATTLSPWIVPMAALAPYRTPAPAQDPLPPSYLRAADSRGVAIDLEVRLNGVTISRVNFQDMYWTMAQQLAHITSNGTTIRPGDLYASGTVSGADPGSRGSLIELTWNGTEPLRLDDGSVRTFLEDGDTVLFTARAAAPGLPTIGFGTCEGTIVAAT